MKKEIGFGGKGMCGVWEKISRLGNRKEEIGNIYIFFYLLRDYQKINYPILWDGHPARP
jgi:hypothetical protein